MRKRWSSKNLPTWTIKETPMVSRRGKTGTSSLLDRGMEQRAPRLVRSTTFRPTSGRCYRRWTMERARQVFLWCTTDIFTNLVAPPTLEKLKCSTSKVAKTGFRLTRRINLDASIPSTAVYCTRCHRRRFPSPVTMTFHLSPVHSKC